METIIDVTSREFKEKQKEPLDKGVTFSPEALERIEKSRQQARDGKYIECRTKEESRKLLESL
jgi:actin-related protein